MEQSQLRFAREIHFHCQSILSIDVNSFFFCYEVFLRLSTGATGKLAQKIVSRRPHPCVWAFFKSPTVNSFANYDLGGLKTK